MGEFYGEHKDRIAVNIQDYRNTRVRRTTLLFRSFSQISFIILISSHAEELMKYLKKYYVEKLNDVKEEFGEELDCVGKPLAW